MTDDMKKLQDAIKKCRKEHCDKCFRKYMPDCPYNCIEYASIVNLAVEILKEQENERRRMLSWLGKFCRHIDNRDKWLTDEENIEFFREKMKQQFGWDTD